MTGLSLRDAAQAVLVALIWGMGFVVAKGAMADFPPILLMALRFGITALALVWFAGPIGANLKWLVLISLVGAAIQYSLTFTGIKGVDVGLAALVVQLEVPFLVILGALILGERPAPLKWVGIAVAFVGVAVISWSEPFRGALLPVALLICGAFSWALGQVMVRFVVGMSGLSITAWTALLAAPQLLLLSLLFEDGQRLAILRAGPDVLAAALYLGLVMTALGYFLWNALILRNEVGRIAPFLLLLPIFSMIGGVIFLGEDLTAHRLIGGAVVLSGIGLITLTRTPAKAGASL